MKFILLVEGETEKRVLPDFLSRWLNPKLKQRVGVQPIAFQGWPEFDRKVVKKAIMYLPDASVVGAIGLLDLYGPQFYPADLKSSHEKVAFGTKRFEDQVNHRKFRMFFAVHELEAWILSQPEILPAGVRDALPEKPPESVNSHDNPAKLLDRLYTRFEKDGYKKIVNRTELFSKLDPLIAAAKCPRLAAMLEEMLTMARSAGL